VPWHPAIIADRTNPCVCRRADAKPLVNSTLTIAIAVGQSVTDVSQNVFANLQMDEIKLTHPVFAGDTLWSASLVLTERESKSRPHAGIVTVRTRTLNQDGEEVCSFLRTFYVYKRGAPGEGASAQGAGTRSRSPAVRMPRSR
jgi:acyl dehydratase